MNPDQASDPTHLSAPAHLGAQMFSCEAAPDTAVPTCGAKTRCGAPCLNYAMRNGRCRMHGGASTGPKTAAGLAAMRAAVTIHGGRSRETIEFRRLVRELQRRARRACEVTE